MNKRFNLSSCESEVLTFSALLNLLGRRSRQSVYDLMRRDSSFPKPRQLGSEFSIGWLRAEVMEWLNSRPRVELNGLDAQIKQMAQIFAAVKEVKASDVITLDYLPASGTRISVNGALQGTITGATFNAALLKIWLGKKPVQDDLKLKLLGQ